MDIESAHQEQSSNKPRKLIPVTDWNKHHSWPKVSGLRHLIFHESTNGFSYCVRRVGRRVLIDELLFFEWVDRKNEDKDSV